MNLQNKANDVNDYKLWFDEYCKAVFNLSKTEKQLKSSPDDGELTGNLKAAKILRDEVTKKQIFLLQQISQQDIEEIDYFYNKAENDEYVIDEIVPLFFDKMNFLYISIENGLKPQNVDQNCFEEEIIAPDGLPAIETLEGKIEAIADARAILEAERRKSISSYTDIEEFCDKNNISLPNLPNYRDKNEMLQGFPNQVSDYDLFMVDFLFECRKELCNPFLTDMNIPLTADLELTSKKILDESEQIGEFDYSYLPSALRGFIEEKCQETEADPIMITQSALCSISAIIGKKACLPGYFNPLYPNIWAITISPSGSFKTTALNKGGQPAYEKRQSIMALIESEQQKFTNIKKPNDSQIKKHAQKIDQLRKKNPILPIRSTGEGLMDLLKDDKLSGYEHNGGMVIASEFAEWAQNLDRTHNLGFKQLLTNIYDVPEVWEYVTKTQGSFVVHRPFITINAVSTLAWIMENLKPNDVSSGFFTRFLLFYPPQKIAVPPALPGKANSRQAFNKLWITLNNFNGNRKYILSPEATDLFDQIHKKMYAELDSQPEKSREIIGPYLKRWSPYILKIAMLMQAVADPNSDVITDQSIKGSLSIIDYSIKSTVHLFQNELGESEQQRKQRIILEYIAKKGGKASRQQLLTSKILGGGHLEYDYPLETLESAGQIEVFKIKNSKKNWLYILSTN